MGYWMSECMLWFIKTIKSNYIKANWWTRKSNAAAPSTLETSIPLRFAITTDKERNSFQAFCGEVANCTNSVQKRKIQIHKISKEMINTKTCGLLNYFSILGKSCSLCEVWKTFTTIVTNIRMLTPQRRKRQRPLVFSRLSKVLIFHHREMSVLKMTHSFHHFGNKVEFSLSGYVMTLNGLRWSSMDLILWSPTPPHDFIAVYVFEYRLKLAASLGPFQVSLKRSCSFSFVVSFTYFSGSPSSFFKTWCLLEANSSLLRQYYLSKQRN